MDMCEGWKKMADQRKYRKKMHFICFFTGLHVLWNPIRDLSTEYPAAIYYIDNVTLKMVIMYKTAEIFFLTWFRSHKTYHL